MGYSLNLTKILFLISLDWLKHVCPMGATVARIMHSTERRKKTIQSTAIYPNLPSVVFD